MAKLAVSELLGDGVGPALEFGRVHLNNGATDPTGQMVVMCVDDATSIQALAALAHHHVHLACFDQSLQLGVDGREGDLTATFHDEGVQVLGADELLHARERLDDLTALCGVSSRGHEFEPTGTPLLFGIILSSIIGMVLKKAFVVGALVFVLAVIAAMVTIGVAGNRTASKPLIVSGVSQWGTLARQLVGPDARVVSLITDPNADPHQHEATVADAANVADADVVLLNGAGYDTWLSQLVANRSGAVSTINVASLMHVATGKNPHLFYDPRGAIRFVETLTTMLEHRRGFTHLSARSQQLLAQLNALQHSAVTIRQSCAGVAVAATEDVTTYLLSDMGLKIVTPEALRLAVGNGVDPSVSDLALALAQINQHPAFLVDNTQTATPLTNEMVARAQSAHVPVIKVTETMTGTNYVTWINGVVHSILQALTKEGCIK